MIILDPAYHMIAVLVLMVIVIVVYATEKISLEVTSASTVAILLLFFGLFPYQGDGPPINSRTLLAGLADPALITVLALLVVGQGMIRTGTLDLAARRLATLRRHRPALAITTALLAAAVISAFLNNTPVVVIFIPLMAVLAERMNRSASSIMIPLSYAAILGGMTTLIGSSTNLLVSGAAEALGLPSLSFFQFSLPGLFILGIGLVYVVVLAPRILPDRETLADDFVGQGGKQFIAQFVIHAGSPLIGEKPVAGMFKSLPDITVRLIQRDEEAILPPFEGISLREGDELILAGTRQALTDALAGNPDLLRTIQPDTSASSGTRDTVLVEAVVAPASRFIGRNLQQIAFHHSTRCTVLGIQRRSRMIRQAMNEIRLEAGDVLLLVGERKDVQKLRSNPDVLLIEWSTRDLPVPDLAKRAAVIFIGVVLAAASGIVPTVAAAVTGALAMIATGCLNVYQASRAIDRRVILLVWAALALGTALARTGGAEFLAHAMVAALDGAPPLVLLSAFFLLVAGLTNVLSNNATAVLFTPIGVGIARQTGIDPMIFVYAVIFAANCSFATPIGYQTNLLVMGPGHYRFKDYLQAGTPLILIVWASFTAYAYLFYGL